MKHRPVVPPPSLHVRMLSAAELFYDGEASAVSAVDAQGPFDVLARHANFIALLSPGEVVVHTPQGKRRVTIAKGLIQVSNNRVLVLVNF